MTTSTSVTSSAVAGVLHADDKHFSFPVPGFSCVIVLLAVAVWIAEYRRRVPHSSGDLKWRLCRQLMPEVVGVVIMTGLVVLLLTCRRDDRSLQDDASWIDVKKDWPLLMTADTLIGLQAMLRLALLLSASFRRLGVQMSPLEGEPAAFFLLASLVRVILLALSPQDIYHLDGPLGGQMNVALEVSSMLLLLPLGYRMFHQGCHRIMAFIFACVVLALAAKYNHFALAGDSPNLDVLFSLVMLLETAAAVAFYVRSSKSKFGALEAFNGFAHFLLPLQQALPAYFLIVAFAPPFQVEPSLVGKGCPFELLQAGGLLQIVMYMLSGIVFYVVCAEESKVSLFAVPVPVGEAPPADECCICLGSCMHCEDIENLKPSWRRLRCGHHFHERCIFEWLKKSHNCPMCRGHVCSGKNAGTAAELLSNAGAQTDARLEIMAGGESSPLLGESDQHQSIAMAESLVM